MTHKRILVLAALLLAAGAASAQRGAVKTNLLHWATTTPNVAVEMGLGPRTTVEVAGGYNNWKLGGEKTMAHFIVQPEIRHWFCQRFAGSFVGAHLHGGEFNLNGIGPFTILKENRHEGWFLGAGVSFGHHWVLGDRWGLEAEIGVGYAYMDYKRYGCAKCDPLTREDSYHYFGPTRAAVSLVYYFR